MIQSPLVLCAAIAAATALAFWLDWRFTALGKVGASLLAIVFGALLSNTGVVPASSPVYDAVLGPVTSLAIAWLLLSVNLGDLKKAGLPMVGAFGVAVAGTALGAFAATAVYQTHFGDDTWRLAAAMTGTYSGGSVNFISVGRAVGLSGPLFAGATAADNVVTGLWLAATLMLPIWLRRFYPPATPPPPVSSASAPPPNGPTNPHERDPNPHEPDPNPHERNPPSHERPDRHEHHPYFALEGVSAARVAGLFAAGLLLLVASEWLGSAVPSVPAILWLTTLALLLGHTPLFRKAPGAMQLGSVGLHFFFVLIGVLSRFSEIAAVGVEVLFFTLIVVGVHGVFVFGVGKLLRLDMGSIAVASQASVGGPSSALAVAVSREWRHLVLPGVVVGLLGYAVGTYLGLGVGYVLRGW